VRIALLNSLVVMSTLAAAQIPVLQVAPVSVSFIAAEQGQPPAQQVRIRNTGSGALQWRAVADAPWIRVSPAAGTGPAVLTIAIDAARLEPGVHDGRVTIDAGNADDSPVMVAVTARITTAARGAGSPPTAPVISLAADAGSTTPAAASFALDGPTRAPTGWHAVSDQAWLTVVPAASTTPTQVSIEANPAGLPSGAHAGTVRFFSTAGDPLLAVPVSLAIGGSAARRSSAAPRSASATAGLANSGPPVPLRIGESPLPPAMRNLPYSQAIPVTGGTPPYAIRLVQGRLPLGLTLANGAISGMTRYPGTYTATLAVTDSAAPPATVTRSLALRVIILLADSVLVVEPAALQLRAVFGQRGPRARIGVGSGRQPLDWKASSDAAWLKVMPASGTSPSIIQVDVSAEGLAPGTYVATVTVTMEGAPNSPARIPVQVTVQR
jgi:hypothetical protein